MVRVHMPINTSLVALDAVDVRKGNVDPGFTGIVRQVFSMLDNVIGR